MVPLKAIMKVGHLKINKDFVEVPVRNNHWKVIMIGSDLLREVKEQLIMFLLDNVGLFNWFTQELPNIDPKVACHSLVIRKIVPYVVQSMCVDYSYLNRPCPKYTYYIPIIDKLVNNSSDFKLLSFMDA